MKIVICSSMAFAQEILDTQRALEDMGHACLVPEGIPEFLNGEHVSGVGGAQRKIDNDFIRSHWKKIKRKDVDVVLILNHSKNGIRGYVGGNSFLEMGFAHVLRKPIFLLFPIPDMPSCKEEMEGMQPTILDGDLSRITV